MSSGDTRQATGILDEPQSPGRAADPDNPPITDWTGFVRGRHFPKTEPARTQRLMERVRVLERNGSWLFKENRRLKEALAAIASATEEPATRERALAALEATDEPEHPVGDRR
jgi:hypothetical protein